MREDAEVFASHRNRRELVAAGQGRTSAGREQRICVLNCSADNVRISHGGGEGSRRRVCIAQRRPRNSRRDSGEPVQGVALHRGLLWCSSGTSTKPAAGKCSGGEGRWGGGGGMREGASGGVLPPPFDAADSISQILSNLEDGDDEIDSPLRPNALVPPEPKPKFTRVPSMASHAHVVVLVVVSAVHVVLCLQQTLRLRDSDLKLRNVAARVELYFVRMDGRAIRLGEAEFEGDERIGVGAAVQWSSCVETVTSAKVFTHRIEAKIKPMSQHGLVHEETSIGVSLGNGYGEGEEEARERVKPVIRRQNTITFLARFDSNERSTNASCGDYLISQSTIDYGCAPSIPGQSALEQDSNCNWNGSQENQMKTLLGGQTHQLVYFRLVT
ncbi:hypothetical protein B0H13DRAFT_2275277, partial [Mycena leptocephala]